MIKVLERLGLQKKYFNIIKVIYSKPTVNIKLKRGELNAIPLKPGKRESC